MTFLQLSYNFAMSCLWCLWEVYEVYEKSMRLTDKSVQKRPRRNILTCRDVARWSRSPTDLSMRSMSLIDKSVPVEYRYSFVTALLQQLFLSTNHIAPNDITSPVTRIYWLSQIKLKIIINMAANDADFLYYHKIKLKLPESCIFGSYELIHHGK